MLRKRTLVLLALAMSLGVWQFTIRARGAAPASSLASPILTGMTRAASGAPLEGVQVSARLEGKTITTTVYTDEQGRYVFPPLASGKYSMWTNAVGFETSWAELNVDAARANTQAFTLKPMADFSNQLNSTEWLAALPENTVADRRAKEVFRTQCNQCHNLNYALQNRFDEAGWRIIVELMSRTSVYQEVTTIPEGKSPEEVLGLGNLQIRLHMEELVAYLTKYRGPNSPPLNFKPVPRPRGEAARIVTTTYLLPMPERPAEHMAQDGSDWSEGIPSMAYDAHDAYADHIGNVWISNGHRNKNVSLYKVDVKTGQVWGYGLPDAKGEFARGNHGITRDQKGLIWTDQHDPTRTTKGLLRIDPKTDEMTIFYPPRSMGRGAGTTTSVDWDPQGRIWAGTLYGQIAFDPATQLFNYFTFVRPGNGSIYGATADADGNGWVSQPRMDAVTKADYKTGKSYEVVIPPRNEIKELFTKEEQAWYESRGALDWGGQGDMPWQEYTRRLGGDKVTPQVFVPLWWGESLAQIDSRTYKVTYHKVPLYKTSPYFAVVDKNGNAFTNLMSDDRIAKFNPKTGQYTIFTLPDRHTVTRNTNIDDYQKETEMWQASWGRNKLYRLQTRTEAELKAVQ